MNLLRKQQAMMKTIRFLSMAALVLVGAITIGCSSDDDSNVQPPTQPETSKRVTLTTTISLDGSATTRALTSEGEKTFAEGDRIAVVYTNKSNMRVTAVSNALQKSDITNNNKNARISVTLDDPVAGSVDYIYPAAMANDDGTINYSALCMQDGTLQTLAAKLDCAKGSGNMTVSGNEYVLPANVSLQNMLAVCKFKIKNSGGAEITNSITGLTISDGTNTYTVSRTTATDNDPIYVALQPVTSDKTISLVAIAGNASGSYYKSVSNKALDAGDMVPVNVTMTQGRIIDLSTLTADCEAQHGDILINKLMGSYKVSVAAGATVILHNASINYDTTPVLSGAFAGITCLGSATLVVSGNEDFVKGLGSGYPGIFVPSGSTLTVTGSGTLYALGQEYGAGIGSGLYNINDYKDCGNIVIQGGTIWATGGGSAAGIGSGASIIFTQYDTGTPSTCGNITIKSSVTQVYATAGSGAESIGKGQYSDCSAITIEDLNKVTLQ